jgi:hypothetical protein
MAGTGKEADVPAGTRGWTRRMDMADAIRSNKHWVWHNWGQHERWWKSLLAFPDESDRELPFAST